MIHLGLKRVKNEIYYTLNILVVLGSWWVAYVLREHLLSQGIFGFQRLVSGISGLYPLMIISALAFPVLFSVNKVFHGGRFRALSSLIFGILKCVAELVGISIIFSFLFFRFDPNRSLIVLFGIVLFILSVLKELLIRKAKEIASSDETRKIPCLLIGAPHDIAMMTEKIQSENVGVKIQGSISWGVESDGEMSSVSEAPVFGGSEELASSLEKHHVGLVIIATYYGFESRVEKILAICEERGIEVWLKNRVFERQIAKMYSGYLADIPMLVFSSTPPYSWSLFLKRVFDVAVALCFLPFFGVLFVIIGIGIKLSSPGPILFKQKRGGLFGKPFVFYKFRTMDNNAEQRREELQRFNIMTGPVFKVKNDPRIFPLGRFLRKTSLDETPQVLNILLDEMSVIGSRPLPMVEVADIKGWQRRRFSMKPGITCLWQIKGRNRITDFKEWARLDLEYIDTWSLWLDFKIFFKTIPVVFFQKGSE